ncbi:MAG: hypothetical protein O8C66_08800 [Candidatus Methanoperedens sp.]|nr:hypothetical protein [Candidatus Methanoperedens sp.]MCZ7370594.1 hypothetical protein [Candidatus Methanoperedens sp.]
MPICHIYQILYITIGFHFPHVFLCPKATDCCENRNPRWMFDLYYSVVRRTKNVTLNTSASYGHTPEFTVRLTRPKILMTLAMS